VNDFNGDYMANLVPENLGQKALFRRLTQEQNVPDGALYPTGRES